MPLHAATPHRLERLGEGFFIDTVGHEVMLPVCRVLPSPKALRFLRI